MPGCYVVFHKQLGDLLLLQPAIARLAAAHGTPVRVLTRSGHRDLLHLMPGATYQPRIPLRPLRHLYAFDPLGKTATRSLLAPAARKVCLIPDRAEAGPWLRFVYREILVPGLGPEYIAHYFWRCLPLPTGDTATCQTLFSPPHLDPPPDSWKPAHPAPPSRFALINPTAGWRRKSWKPEAWADVVRGLLRAGTPAICLTSGPADWQVAHMLEIATLVNDPRVSCLQNLPLRSYLWLCSRASIVLAVDGAASHLAAAFGIPSVTLFGPTNRSHWHNPTPTSLALQATPDKDGTCRVRNIPPHDVLSAALQLC